MKKLSIATMVAVIAALLVATVAFAMFTNGNFEAGTFTGWLKDTTNQNGGILVGPPPSYVPHSAASVDDMFIVNTAWMNTNFGAGNTCDPYSNGSICLPYAGDDSAVVNYLGDNGNLNKLSQQGLVASGDVGADGMYHIFFTYAPVLDKGSHSAADQPFMYVKLTRVRSGSPDKVLFDKFSYPDDGNPNWRISPISSSVKYMPWQVYDLTYAPADLGDGDTLTLDVVAAGCVYTQGAHWGYVYVDEFGPVSPTGSTAPSISSVSPSSGPDSGGTSVTIVGSNFTGATAVSIGASTLLSGSFTVVDDTHITFTTPANAAGIVDISVINPGGSAVYPSGFTYVTVPAPTINSIVPNSGPEAGGTSVVITGTAFTGATIFTFDGTAATCTVDSATQITCTSPAHAAGAVDVVVTTLGGSATSAGGFTYVPAPTISSVVPNSGPAAGGTSVVITGTDLTGGTVTFDGVPATCTVDSATQITCTSPAHAAGAVDVVVTTLGGSATSAGGFTYVPAPTISSVVPNSGPAAGGTSVVITGTNFTGATAFTFGGTAATCTVDLDTQITCTSPSHAAGAVDVVVTTLGGTATSVGGFTYIPAPTISSIVPNSGPTAGGTSVVLTGTNFTGGTVTFDGTTATCTVDSDMQITCDSPAHVAGAVDVVVTTLGGSATSAGGFTYVPAPSITSIVPNSGPTAGGTSVVITGTNLSGGAVTFDGTVATCTVNTATQITCTSPAHAAGPVDVVVTTSGGAATSAGGFTYVPAPTISSIVPNAGPTAGGTSVVITDTNLIGGTATFDGLAATCTVDSVTQMTCVSPAHAAGPVDVVVTTPGGEDTSVNGFTYIAVPTISSIVPNVGPTAGGTTVVITGTDLATTFHVEFGAAPASCTVDSDIQITCTSPAHAAGPVDVDVSTAGGIATSTNGFTYIPVPSIASIVPNAGPTIGGTTVVITGTDLATTFHVEFGAAPASCTVDSDIQITCTSPAHAAGPVDVDVSTAGGIATSTNGFTYVPAPTISTIVPNSGPTAGGTTVVITGANFTGGTVTFDGTAATCTVNSDTQITCTSPAHAAGPVDVVVTTIGGSATFAGSFTYIPQAITGLAPNSGPTMGGTSVVITGIGFTGSTAFTFGGTAATCTVNSDTQITCASPAHAAGPVDVVVTTPTGAATSAGGFTYIPATLTITAAGPATVRPGDQYVYTFNYTTNVKPFSAQVLFTLPGHATYVSNSGGYTCAPAAGVVTCTLGAITTNGSFTVTVLVDKLKKVNTPLTLAVTSYSISDNGAAVANGLVTVTANTLTPFADVTLADDRLDYVQSVWAYGITSGCLATNPLTYCPDVYIPREQMAVFIERGIHGGSYDPGILPLTFTDTNFAKYWIEALRADGITAGCNPGSTLYCPGSPITRAQMAVFLLRGKYGASFVPSGVTVPTWTDVPLTYWASQWTYRLGADGISNGCGRGEFCPDSTVSRGEMAVLVQRTFSLPMPTP